MDDWGVLRTPCRNAARTPVRSGFGNRTPRTVRDEVAAVCDGDSRRSVRQRCLAGARRRRRGQVSAGPLSVRRAVRRRAVGGATAARPRI